MDEFIGLPLGAPQRFSEWLRRHVFSRVPDATAHCLMPDPDPETEAVRYAALLAEAPIDAVCLGIGINGHIAFNDPPVADFEDPLDVKVVEMDEICRRQQVDDEGFPDIEAVPRKALTLTVPRLMRADRLFCMVPGAQKAAAVRDTLNGPVSTATPASVLRRHPDCTLYLDTQAASHV
jgi:glucosamine-6-phosphate deaminase